MADLLINKSPTTDTFVAELAKLNVTLPVNIDDKDIGVIVDAEGRDVITIDVNGVRADAAVEQIAHWVVLAINTCGGFRAQRQDSNG